MEKDFEFNEWCDIFIDKCRSLGYKGPIDPSSFDLDYEDDKSPEQAAEEFVKEMND